MLAAAIGGHYHGCFMNSAYDWAFAKPIRKVHYNLTITGLSVFVAVFIGTIEILGLIGQEYDLNGGYWSLMANFDINKAGVVIVGVFVVTWPPLCPPGPSRNSEPHANGPVCRILIAWQRKRRP